MVHRIVTFQLNKDEQFTAPWHGYKAWHGILSKTRNTPSIIPHEKTIMKEE